MKAIALVSGGLDSTLAAKLIKDQGIEITVLNFKTPFCQCDRKNSSGCASFSRKLAEDLGLDFKVMNVSEDFFQIIKSPKHGFGSNMNPCIDCRILIMRKAKEYMQETGAKFVVSGEVLGQRPMSQHRKALELIEREAGLEGLILRPLSAKLMPETVAEKEGWVEREKLLDINGRGRRPQMQLAQEFNIKDYPCPAGGCLLTDPEFSNRMKDLLKYSELNLNNVELLKVGRHFRFSEKVKLIVGRNERENERIANLAKAGDYLFEPQELAGPTALARGEIDEGLIGVASAIVCRYCDSNGTPEAKITCKIFPGTESRVLKAFPIAENELVGMRI